MKNRVVEKVKEKQRLKRELEEHQVQSQVLACVIGLLMDTLKEERLVIEPSDVLGFAEGSELVFEMGPSALTEAERHEREGLRPEDLARVLVLKVRRRPWPTSPGAAARPAAAANDDAPRPAPLDDPCDVACIRPELACRIAG